MENKSASNAANNKKTRLLSRVGSFRLSVVLVLLLVVAVAAAVFFYTKYQTSQDKLKHPDQIVKSQTDQLVAEVGQHVELPTGEEPTVATVSDVSKLSGQAFFANAKNGDKVLIYTKAKKAILYRPAEQKVINVAPLNISQ